MANDDYKKRLLNLADAEDDDGGDAAGSAGSAIAFADFIGVGENWRDDLPQGEKEHFLSVHKDANKEHVEKQAEKLKQYEDLKNGKRSLEIHRRERQGEATSHPLLSQEAQFSGMRDSNMNEVPSENNNEEANPNDRNELRMQLQQKNQLRHQHANTYQPPRLTK